MERCWIWLYLNWSIKHESLLSKIIRFLVQVLCKQINRVIWYDIRNFKKTLVESWNNKLHEVVPKRHLFYLFFPFFSHYLGNIISKLASLIINGFYLFFFLLHLILSIAQAFFIFLCNKIHVLLEQLLFFN